MFYRISKFMVLTVFILKFFILYANAKPPPSTNSPPSFSPTIALNSCNCIRAKDCVEFEALVRQLRGVIERMRNAACGLAADNSEPMVCCPTNERTSKPERSYNTQAFNMHDDFSTASSERWIWDRRPKTSKDDDRQKATTTEAISIQTKFLAGPLDYDYTHTNLLDDYYDWKARKNCPPILYRDKQNLKPNSKWPHSPQYHERHHHPFHHDHHPYHDDYHHSPHEHHFEFNHHHHTFGHADYDADYADDHHDGAIIYPDNRHTFRPTHSWPDPDISASSNRKQPAITTSTVLPTTETLTTTVSSTPRPTINSPNCGITLNKRIIGGIEALPGEFPWITRIAYLNRSDNTLAYRCSGSFVTELHIITAAHCVTNLDASLTLSHIRIADLSTDNEQQGQGIYEIAETFVHPNFDRPKRANDIALIKILRPAGVVANYGTICLPRLTNFLNSGTGVVAGWSNNEGVAESDQRVRYLKLPIINNTECANRYDMFRQGFAEKITIDNGMLCTQGLTNGSDVCRGDSGGPLMDDGSSAIFSNEGRYTLLGIVAFGPICGFTNLLPGVYMRVSEFVNWISSTVR